tara:strand:+ start:348 stop:704 length:357 start_codon:yes stop_codon:yes gene_type:complete
MEEEDIAKLVEEDIEDINAVFDLPQVVDKEYIVTFIDVDAKNKVLQDLEVDTSNDDNVDSNIVPDRKILSDVDSKNDNQKRNVKLTLENNEVEILSNNSNVLSISPVFIFDESWLDVI